MIKLLRFLWTGSWHEHDWETQERILFFDDDSGKRPIATKYILRCKHCGTIKKKEV